MIMRVIPTEANVRLDGSSVSLQVIAGEHFLLFFRCVGESQKSLWENSEACGGQLLKSGASWGRLGNNGIGNYDHVNVYSPANTSFAMLSNKVYGLQLLPIGIFPGKRPMLLIWDWM